MSQANRLPKELRQPVDVSDAVMVLEFELDQLSIQMNRARNVTAQLKLQDRYAALERAIEIVKKIAK